MDLLTPGNLLIRLVLLAALIGAAGCNTAPALPKGYPATGSVAFKGGKPLKGGSIEFVSADDPLLRVIGEIQSDGTFALKTIKDAIADGAPEGEYRVTVTLPRANQDPQKSPPAVTLDQPYKVNAQPNTFKIELPIAPP